MTDDFRYLLVVLTHGRHGPGDTLERSLGSFLEHVTPRPAELFIHQDGDDVPHYYGVGAIPIAMAFARSDRIGFCGATAKAWEYATSRHFPYVFWLEHDFTFMRPVDLRELAVVLESHHRLAQLALVRGAVNPVERMAGGLIESRPGHFCAQESVAGPWLLHRSFFTTNPSLMRRRFMAENPFRDDGQPQCEGRYGISLIERGYDFGYWGSGEQWVDHIGVRTGVGY